MDTDNLTRNINALLARPAAVDHAAPIMVAGPSPAVLLQAAEAIGPIPEIPTLSQLINDPTWYDTATDLQLRAHAPCDKVGPMLRVRVLDALRPLQAAGRYPHPISDAERARAKYERQYYRDRPGPALIDWHKRAHLTVEAKLSLWVSTFPTIRVEVLRAALYLAHERDNPLPGGEFSLEARMHETPQQRSERLEQWAREGRQIHWQLTPAGSAERRVAREEAAQLRVIAKRQRDDTRRDARHQRRLLQHVERDLRRTVPGTPAHQHLRDARVAVAGRMRFNLPWHERCWEDEAFLLTRPDLPVPRAQLHPQLATPMHSRARFAHNDTPMLEAVP